MAELFPNFQDVIVIKDSDFCVSRDINIEEYCYSVLVTPKLVLI